MFVDVDAPKKLGYSEAEIHHERNPPSLPPPLSLSLSLTMVRKGAECVAYFFHLAMPFASWTDVQQVKMSPVPYERKREREAPSIPTGSTFRQQEFGESTC